MMGKFNGCAAIIRRQFPQAVPIHCFNHRLNLVLSKACEIREVKVALQTMTEIHTFIYSSNMRNLRFSELVTKVVPTDRRKLVQLCPTRWVERHDAVNVFVELLPAVALFLEEETQHDGRAGILLAALREPKFLVGLLVVEAVFSHTVVPSKALQSSTGDLAMAYTTVRSIQKVFEEYREDSKEHFGRIFHRVEDLLGEVGSAHEKVTAPRTCSRLTQRSNVEADSPEEYFRRSVFLPFLDFVIAELDRRFGDDSVPIMFNAAELMKGGNMDTEKYLEATDKRELARAEAERWRLTAPSFKSLVEAHTHASERLFPIIKESLVKLITLPVTNAEAERSFSALKRLKTYLRSTMNQERLTGLAILAVHKDVHIDSKDIIERFALKNRKMMFV